MWTATCTSGYCTGRRWPRVQQQLTITEHSLCSRYYSKLFHIVLKWVLEFTTLSFYRKKQVEKLKNSAQRHSATTWLTHEASTPVWTQSPTAPLFHSPLGKGQVHFVFPDVLWLRNPHYYKWEHRLRFSKQQNSLLLTYCVVIGC